MMLPTIHTNGTSAESLATAVRAAADALYAAQDALAATAPNGRDYYPQGDEALAQATREHRARVAHLQAVTEELAALYEHLVSYL